MQVKVKLFATLREGRQKEYVMDFENNPTPADIFIILRIKHDDVAILLVNGMNGSFDQLLNTGDTISVFPPVGGG